MKTDKNNTIVFVSPVKKYHFPFTMEDKKHHRALARDEIKKISEGKWDYNLRMRLGVTGWEVKYFSFTEKELVAHVKLVYKEINKRIALTEAQSSR